MAAAAASSVLATGKGSKRKRADVATEGEKMMELTAKRFKRMGNPLVLLQVDNIRPLACLPKDFGSTVRFVMMTDGNRQGIRCSYSDASNSKILFAFFECQVVVNSSATEDDMSAMYTVPAASTGDTDSTGKKYYCIKIDTCTFRDVLKNFVQRNYRLTAGVFADNLSMVFRNANENNHYKFDMSLLVDSPSEEDIPIDLSGFMFDFVAQLSTKMLMVILDMLKKLCSQLFVEISILRAKEGGANSSGYIRFCSKDASKTEMKGMTAYYRCVTEEFEPDGSGSGSGGKHALLAEILSAETTTPKVANVVFLKGDTESYSKEFSVEEYEMQDNEEGDEFENEIDEYKYEIAYREQYPVDAVINFLSDVRGDSKVLLFMLKAMPLVIQSKDDESASWMRLCLAPRTLEDE